MPSVTRLLRSEVSMIKARVAAMEGDTKKARRGMKSAVAADPGCIEKIVASCYQAPGLKLSKTFLKVALKNPQIKDVSRRRQMAWDLNLAAAALNRTTDYAALYADCRFSVNPSELMQQYRAAAQTLAKRDAKSAATNALAALRVGFLKHSFRDFTRCGYGRNECLGVELAAMYGLLADAVGSNSSIAQALNPQEASRAIQAAVQWGDIRGLRCLLDAGVQVYNTETLVTLLVNPPSMALRMQWLGLQHSIEPSQKMDLLRRQNITNLRILVAHGLEINLVATRLLEQDVIDLDVLEVLLTHHLDPNFLHPRQRCSFLGRGVAEKNPELVKLMYRFKVNDRNLGNEIGQEIARLRDA